jgi:hypothetical protein
MKGTVVWLICVVGLVTFAWFFLGGNTELFRGYVSLLGIGFIGLTLVAVAFLAILWFIGKCAVMVVTGLDDALQDHRRNRR